MTRSVLWSFLLQLEIVFLKRRLDDLKRFPTTLGHHCSSNAASVQARHKESRGARSTRSRVRSKLRRVSVTSAWRR
jgi:hypothetical protein